MEASLLLSLLVVATVSASAYRSGSPPTPRWHNFGLALLLFGVLASPLLAMGAVGQDDSGWFAGVAQVFVTLLAASGSGGIAVALKGRSDRGDISSWLAGIFLCAPLLLALLAAWRAG